MDTPARVLVVEDDATVAEVVELYLRRDGFAVEVARNGKVGLERALADPPDLVVLDLMLPGMDGMQICRRLRALAPVPVIMLTARGDESDRIAGLELGADDYLTKPFSPKELVARVRAVLRRTSAAGTAASVPPIHEDGDLRVDVAARVATIGGVPVALTAREFELLAFLLRHPNQAFSREELMGHVWGSRYGDTSTITVHIRRLREKIEADPSAPERIATVWGVGYRWQGRHPAEVG